MVAGRPRLVATNVTDRTIATATAVPTIAREGAVQRSSMIPTTSEAARYRKGCLRAEKLVRSIQGFTGGEWTVDKGQASIHHLLAMTERPLDLIQQRVNELARSTEAPSDSFLTRRLALEDPEQIRSVIDGMTLSLISYCYHRHPRGENVHEVMERLEGAEPGSEQATELERRADDAAALQIPFIVTLNRLVEEYYDLRRNLEDLLTNSS